MRSISKMEHKNGLSSSFFSIFPLLEVQFPYDPICQSVGWFVRWLVRRRVGLSYFPKRAGSYTLMLLSEHLFLD